MKIFNNLTRQLEDFIPIHSNRVNIYTCGPTVYDHSHIGHARSCMTWDMVYRYFKHKKYQVTWIRNITNIDDKIVKRALEANSSPDKLSREFTYEFWADMHALNISWPDLEPRATDYLIEMFAFIQELIDKNFAYVTKNGDVYFRVHKHVNYGQLKRQSLEQLAEGISRVDENELKESQLDFALWKAFAREPETSFNSPWGIGRPGWHLECSTMIKAILNSQNLGDTLDIHAGGDDLIFPHHENECAQSECLSGKALAKYWMHNGMVMVNGSKMSKSEGNFFTIKDLLAIYKPNTIRYFCLSTHYKKQINFGHEALEAAEQGFDKLVKFLETPSDEPLNQELIQAFENAMDNDFNSAQALALIFENKDNKNIPTLIFLLKILGFDLNNQETTANNEKSEAALAQVMDLVLDLRKTIRENKDFVTSDKIREALSKAGINVKDYRDKASEWELN
ncbi:MAG: cysteine--tRNA ligase [Candidatus Caenarcaniphilales bacterium]|jgi:cysteinyl-tRNA synthetase|nr:cysteine--tRNA ligase [Candidatus Caenarcaniphilales bacterium]